MMRCPLTLYSEGFCDSAAAVTEQSVQNNSARVFMPRTITPIPLLQGAARRQKILAPERRRGAVKTRQALHFESKIFQRSADPHFNHAAAPGKVQIGIVERPRLQARGRGGFANRVRSQFPANQYGGSRLRQKRSRRDSTDRNARRFDSLAVPCRDGSTPPRSESESRSNRAGEVSGNAVTSPLIGGRSTPVTISFGRLPQISDSVVVVHLRRIDRSLSGFFESRCMLRIQTPASPAQDPLTIRPSTADCREQPSTYRRLSLDRSGSTGAIRTSGRSKNTACRRRDCRRACPWFSAADSKWNGPHPPRPDISPEERDSRSSSCSVMFGPSIRPLAGEPEIAAQIRKDV